MCVKAIGISHESIGILHRLEIGITVLDPRTSHHALENQLAAPVVDHAADKAHKGIVDVVRRHGGADAVDMRGDQVDFSNRPASAARFTEDLQAGAVSLLYAWG